MNLEPADVFASNLAGWFDTANAVEAALDRVPTIGRSAIVSELQSAGLVDWTVLPGGEPGDCRQYLLAIVDGGRSKNISEDALKAALQRRLDQVLIYLKRIGPSMDGVVLLLDRSHFMWGGGWRAPAYRAWCEVWCRFRANLITVRPDINVRVVFANAEAPEFDVCHFGVDGAPVGGRQLLEWWRDANAPSRNRLRERILLVRHLGIQADFNCRYVVAQNAAHDNRYWSTGALEFGGVSRRGQEEWRRMVRLYLDPALDLPLVFDGHRYNWAHRMEIHPVSGAHGAPDFIWRPADMQLFSLDPGLWLNQSGTFY